MIDWARVEQITPPTTMGQEIFHVRVSEICPNGLFSICSVAEYLQESAFRNSSLLNLGMEAFAGTSLAWVLARLNIHMRHYPRKGESVAVQTWYAGQQGRFGYRFYRLFDENNMVIATALSTFALFDLSVRKIAQWPDFIKARMPEAGPCPIDFQRGRLEKPENGKKHALFSPRLGDLDLYSHVNNVKLIEWALSATGAHLHHPFQPSALDIVFRHECCLDDQVQIETQVLNEKEEIILLSNQHAVELVRAHISR